MTEYDLDPAYWVPIYGFEDRYKVSRDGRIFSVMRRKVLKPMGLKYLYVRLQKNNKQYCYNVGRLVLGHFGKTSSMRPYVDHINHDTLDNRIENLRAVSCQINNLCRRSNGVGEHGKKYRVRRSCGAKRTCIGGFETKQEAIDVSNQIRDQFVEKAFEHLRFKELRDGIYHSVNSRWVNLHTTNKPRRPTLYIPTDANDDTNDRAASFI